MKCRTIVLLFEAALVIGLLPGLAFAADNAKQDTIGSNDGSVMSTQYSDDDEVEEQVVAPFRPLASQVSCKEEKVYKQEDHYNGDGHRYTQNGDYLGSSLVVVTSKTRRSF